MTHYYCIHIYLNIVFDCSFVTISIQTHIQVYFDSVSHNGKFIFPPFCPFLLVNTCRYIWLHFWQIDWYILKCDFMAENWIRRKWPRSQTIELYTLVDILDIYLWCRAVHKHEMRCQQRISDYYFGDDGCSDSLKLPS